jgi:hypothetical protein
MSAYLLAKTNARTSIEWKEDEWLWYEILVQTIVKETVGIKFFSCPGRTINESGQQVNASYRLDPKDPFGDA